MLNIRRQIGATLIAILALAFISCVPTQASSSSWFQPATPTVTPGKTNVGYKATYPVGCNDRLLFNGSLVDPEFTPTCAVDTAIGVIVPTGKIIIDNKNTYRLTDKTGSTSSFILPIPNNNGFIRTYYAPTWGAYISKYDALTRSDLLKKTYSGLPNRIQYEIQADTDEQLTDSAGMKIQSSGPPMAFSSNGQWMIVDVPYVGLFRVSADLSEMVPFAKSMEQIAPGMGYYAAISNDGNYVAISTTNNLTLHGLASCNQHSFTYGSPVSLAGCTFREIWNDHNGVAGIKENIMGSNQAERLQFIDNDTLKIVGRHHNSSSIDNIYDEYYVSAPGTTLHKLAFMGMGDSYISGEGIGVYQEGTDTSDNKCHLSPQSYPYLIGNERFDSYKSVACSGAKTTDLLIKQSDQYTGQTKQKIQLRYRSPDLKHILAAFSPGYAQQLQFTKEYHPKNAVISIGGNDVNFADMVASCVMPHVEFNTCYDTYEERKQKALNIYKLYDKLVTTYSDILSNGTENLYVIGYPQIAKENGNCAVNVRLSNDEIIFANELIHYLNQTIEAAANKTGARYVDIEHALDGHRLCEAKSSNIAVNGLTMGNDAGIYVPFVDWQLGPLEKASYHPNALGHKLIMKTILEQTDNMQQTMPAKDENAKPPQITDDMPLLAGLSPAPELPKLESVDDITNGALLRGTPSSLYVDGIEANTAPNTKYRLELHSNPTILGYLTSDANGNISGNFTIPGDIDPGIHTLNLYGPSYGGEQIQIQQFVYVAASEDDADGNGVPNSQQPCVVIEPSGQDADEDGIDDACDPIIGDTPAVIDTPQAPDSNTLSPDEMAATSNAKQSLSPEQQSQNNNKNAVLGDKTAAKNKSKQPFSEDSGTTNFLLESLVVAGVLVFGITLLLRNKRAGDL